MSGPHSPGGYSYFGEEEPPDTDPAPTLTPAQLVALAEEAGRRPPPTFADEEADTSLEVPKPLK